MPTNLHRITEMLDRLDRDLERQFFRSLDQLDPSFVNGHPGAAVFYGYYYRLTKNEKHLEMCYDLIDKSLEFIGLNNVPYTLCNGTAGVAWSVQHLVNEKLIDADKSLLEDYDLALTKIGCDQIRKGNYDYLNGGLGCAIYLLSRPDTDELLRQFVEALTHTKSTDDYGVYWMDNIGPIYSSDKRTRVNFGMAHGMPSIIYFLSKVIERGVGGMETKQLLHDSVRYLIHYSDPKNYVGSFFPHIHIFQEKQEKLMSRLAWCYGDLGVISSLLTASQAISDEFMQRDVIKMAIKTTERRIFPETRIEDGGICHGLAGVAHVYNRFFRMTQLKSFETSTTYWIDQLCDYIDSHGGIEEFKEYIGTEKRFKNSYGFLMGSCGAGLVLISIVDGSIDPTWDKFLLLS